MLTGRLLVSASTPARFTSAQLVYQSLGDHGDGAPSLRYLHAKCIPPSIVRSFIDNGFQDLRSGNVPQSLWESWVREVLERENI